ncbi:Predicted O-linked N-acetylglucosamine transferase, SPINDLY family [Sphaerotilus natans]|nr:Predicted O-linked N-acetylglucosamine transferase, SPINDLY family [Sphaerotilus natans]
MDALGPLPALPPVRRTPSSDTAPDERHRSGALPGSLPEPLPRRTLPQQALLDALASRLPAEPATRRPESPQRLTPPAASAPPPSPPPSSPSPLDRAAALLRSRPDPTILIYERPRPGRAASAAADRPPHLAQLLGELAAQPRSRITARPEPLAPTRDAGAGAGLSLARQLTEAGRPGEALDLLDHLDPAPQPRTASWHLARAAAWQQLQRPQEAAREASAALTRTGIDAPTRHAALQQLGQALTLQGEIAEAAWCHRTRLAEHPRDSGAALQAASAAATEADWPALAQDLIRLEQTLQPAPTPAPAAAQTRPEIRTAPDPALLAAFTDDPARLRQAAEQAVQARLGRRVERSPARRRAARAPGSRLRLGLLLGAVPAGAPSPWPIVEMLMALDPAQFDLTVYADLPDAADTSTGTDTPLQPLRERSSRWHDCHDSDEEALALTISADAIDLLAVLDARADTRRLATLARHPAALQIAWADGAGSTGAPFIDYLVGDRERTPIELAADTVEAIAQMPARHRPSEAPAAAPEPPFDPPTRADCGLPETAMVYACFARPGAILPEQFAAWCRVLADTEGAVLWLRGATPTVRARLQEAAAGLGIDPRRLVFAAELERDRHAARLPLADLMLDTFPDSSERRCLEALQQGVLVLSRRGRSPGSRRAAALLQAVGLPELVCDGPERLHIEAVRLGRDAARRAALRDQLRQRLQADPLHDPAGLARDFAALVRRMVDRLDAGLPPVPLAALPAP